MSTDDLTPFEGVPRNPLMAELDENQLELLDTLFFVAYTHDLRGWPVWDYVSRELTRNSADYLDADSLWRSLPRVDIRGTTGTYGLVWHDGGNPSPTPSNRVGLTIAGLAALALKKPEAGMIADDLSRLIGRLAEKERDVTTSPDEVANTTIALDEFKPFIGEGRRTGMSAPLMALADETAVSLLSREYAGLSIARGPAGSGTAHLSPHLRRYRKLRDAAQYLGFIAHDSLAEKVAPPHLRPDELALMLDYASFVLSGHPEWKIGAMASPPDYRTVASLSQDVDNEGDFNSRVSDLWTVLGRLNVPDAEPESSKNRPKSLTRLKMWVEANIDDPAGQVRAAEAIQTIRGVGAVRTYVQHPHEETRGPAEQASLRLGLDFPIRDWATAWNVIRARVADAFYTVSQESRQ